MTRGDGRRPRRVEAGRGPPSPRWHDKVNAKYLANMPATSEQAGRRTSTEKEVAAWCKDKYERRKYTSRTIGIGRRAVAGCNRAGAGEGTGRARARVSGGKRVWSRRRPVRFSPETTRPPAPWHAGTAADWMTALAAPPQQSQPTPQPQPPQPQPFMPMQQWPAQQQQMQQWPAQQQMQWPQQQPMQQWPAQQQAAAVTDSSSSVGPMMPTPMRLRWTGSDRQEDE